MRVERRLIWGASLFSVESFWQGKPRCGKSKSPLALPPAPSPEERELTAYVAGVSMSPLPTARMLFWLQPLRENLDRSHGLMPDDNSPSPGGEGRGEGGSNYQLAGGATVDSQLAALKTECSLAGGHSTSRRRASRHAKAC